MSVGAILAVIAFVLVLVAIGGALLWAGGVAPASIVRLAGFAQLIGLAALGIALVVELSVGIRFDLASLLATVACLIALPLCVAFGRRTLRRSPRSRSPDAPFLRLAVVPVLGLATLVVLLESQFRAARLLGLEEWDAWSFWVPKAESIYYFGGLHGAYKTLAVPYYPPLTPAITASVFEFFGRVDPITLHLFFVFLLVGFVGAAAGLLAPRVRPAFVWPFLLLVPLAPSIVSHAAAPQADLTMDYFLALGALLLALWLEERSPSQLVFATILLAAATLTKREGLLLAACLFAAAFTATWSVRRRAWTRLALAGSAVVAFSLPWRLWVMANRVGGGSPEVGYFGFIHHLDRAWPSLLLTLEVLVGSWWMPIGPLFAVCLVAAAARRTDAVVVFGGAFLGLGILAASWVTMSFPSMPITTTESVNPIVRLAGGIVLPAAALLPMLARTAVGEVQPAAASVAGQGRAGWGLSLGVLAAAATIYPALALADGLPRFPSRSDCSIRATHDGPIDLVFGVYDSSTAAAKNIDAVKRVGFGAQLVVDSCGTVKIAVPGYTTLAGAQSAVAEAKRVGLAATPEVAEGG